MEFPDMGGKCLNEAVAGVWETIGAVKGKPIDLF